jgi:hypothetical protein
MSLSTLILLVVALLVLALAAAVFLVLRSPEASKRRVLALFRRPARPPKAPGRDHYYRPYWS